jgi:UDP-N-acetylmuramyl pentapeptide phosphotransferase/UDP-N-acetylglucosamine-1-phosphate transferase
MMMMMMMMTTTVTVTVMIIISLRSFLPNVGFKFLVSSNYKRVTVFWDVMPEGGGTAFLKNFSEFLLNYTVLYARR